MDGSYETQREGYLNFPCSAKRLKNGNTLITDAGDEEQRGSKILEVDRKGQILWSYYGDLKFAHSAELLPNGNILVTDTTNNRIIEINRDKEIVFSSDSWNSGTGLLSDGSHLDYPNDVHQLDDGTMLITDRNNNRIIIADREGRIQLCYDDKIHHPHNAGITPTGSILIADSDNNRIIEVSREKEIIWCYPEDTESNELNWPRDAQRLESGNTLICDSKNSRVLIIDKSGKTVWSYHLPYFANLYEANYLENGNVLISDQQHQRVFEVSRYGALLWQFRNYVPNRPIYPRIHNGSFRRLAAEGVPEGWMPFRRTAEGGGTIETSQDEQGRPMLSLHFDRSGAFGISQLIAAKPERMYRIAGKIRSENINDPASGFLQLSFRDEYGGFFEDVFSSPRGQLFTGNTEWKEDSFQAQAPKGACCVEIRLFITGPGTIWARNLMLLEE